MIAAIALLVTAFAPVPVVAQDAAPVAPAEWSKMPPLPWRDPPQTTPDVAAFVEAEVRAGRCVAPHGMIAVDVAVLVRGDGVVRAVVPRAADCATVEQFAAGLVTSYVRNNLRLPAAGWYRTALTFEWAR